MKNKTRIKPDESQLEFVCTAAALNGDEHSLYKDRAGQYWLKLHRNSDKEPLPFRAITKIAAIVDWVKASAPERSWVKILTGHLSKRKGAV